MKKETTRPGFQYQKIVAWAPAIVAAIALLFIAFGELYIGLVLVAAAALFWLIVRRRRTAQDSESTSH